MSFDEMLSFVDLWSASFGGITDILNLTFGELFSGFGLGALTPSAIADISLFSVMFASLTVYFSITIIKWVIGIIT